MSKLEAGCPSEHLITQLNSFYEFQLRFHFIKLLSVGNGKVAVPLQPRASKRARFLALDLGFF